MKNLNNEEMVNINGGNADNIKERSFFDSTVNTIGGAITGVVGIVSSWFN